MSRMVYEACCASAEDVLLAERAGADRVELNSCLLLGGLTPSLGMMEAARRAKIPIIAMVRPREGGFCYTETEFGAMCRDAEALLGAGADGIAFGCLLPDGRVNERRCRELMGMIGNKQSVFHRAFDITPDWRQALACLMGLGVTRVLTSGQAPSAPEGAETLKEMMEYAGGRIEILPGGGIRPENAAELAKKTGCRQFHATAHGYSVDAGFSPQPRVCFSGGEIPQEGCYRALEEAKARAMANTLHSLGE